MKRTIVGGGPEAGAIARPAKNAAINAAAAATHAAAIAPRRLRARPARSIPDGAPDAAAASANARSRAD